MKDDRGRSVAEPLHRGGLYCRFHAKAFCTQPVETIPASFVILYLDLETTGVDATSDRIVELAATQGGSQPGASFATVVRVADDILQSPAAQGAAAVHGIPREEIALGPDFPEVWIRFQAFVDGLVNSALTDSDISTDDSEPLAGARPASVSPTVLLAAHNGLKFDFPALLCECRRHRLQLSAVGDWLFVDTLPVLAAVQARTQCLKLQCLARGVCGDLRAHRALDDCIALNTTIEIAAASIGMSSPELLSRFAVRVNLPATYAQLSALCDE